MDTYTLIRYFNCSLTGREEAEVHRWLASDTDGSRKDMYAEARAIYEGMVLYAEDKPAALPSERHRKTSWRKYLRAALHIAAAFVLTAAVGLYSRNETMDSLSSQVEIINVPPCKSMQMTLADGTRMWMNAGTEVEIPVIFSPKERNLKINSGEVFLEVAKDASRPFTIDTYAGHIKVLGTRFNVIVDKELDIFSTALLEGSVELEAEKVSYTLKPNDVVTFKDGNWSFSRLENPSSVECWTSGIIDIAGVSFEELIVRLERTFDVNIVVERSTMPVLNYTRGKIRVSDGIDHALNVMSIASDFTYEREHMTNTIYIR